jgi:replicative DNA helicase
LKALAKEVDVPVVALAQLNRKVEERTNKRPMLSDLRESGAIEQDADLIVFLYRDDVYNTREDNPEKGIAEIIVGKQRNGPVGVAKLKYFSSCTAFENLSSIPEPSEQGTMGE